MDKRIIAKVQSFGFKVYMIPPEKASWLIFTDGTNIGYLQVDHAGGYALATVHIPHPTSGTGFGIAKDMVNFDKPDLEKCFVLVPPWADSRSREATTKWRNIDHFINSRDFNRQYRLVEEITDDPE